MCCLYTAVDRPATHTSGHCNIDTDGWMDGWMDGWIGDGWLVDDGWIDGLKDGWINGWMD